METHTGGTNTRVCAPMNSRVRAYELASHTLARVTLPVICTVKHELQDTCSKNFNVIILLCNVNFCSYTVT